MALPPEEVRFAANCKQLIEIAKTTTTTLYEAGKTKVQPMLVELVQCILQNYNQVSLIEGFIRHSHIHWDNIRKSEEVFFIENASSIFGHLPADKVNLFRDMFTATDEQGQPIVDNETRQAIWRLMHGMVKISIKYCAKKSYLPDKINPHQHAQAWQINI